MRTVYRWRREAGISIRRGPHGVHRASLALWGMLTDEDWKKGILHVSKLIGVSQQAVWQMRQRMVRAGYNLPEKDSRPRKG